MRKNTKCKLKNMLQGAVFGAMLLSANCYAQMMDNSVVISPWEQKQIEQGAGYGMSPHDAEGIGRWQQDQNDFNKPDQYDATGRFQSKDERYSKNYGEE